MFSYSASLNLPTRFFSPSDCAESSWLVAEVSSAAAELLCTTLEICSIPCSICFNIFACSVELSLAPFAAFAKSFMDSRILFNAATVFSVIWFPFSISCRDFSIRSRVLTAACHPPVFRSDLPQPQNLFRLPRHVLPQWKHSGTTGWSDLQSPRWNR